jgi:hypothetical protein
LAEMIHAFVEAAKNIKNAAGSKGNETLVRG